MANSPLPRFFEHYKTAALQVKRQATASQVATLRFEMGKMTNNLPDWNGKIIFDLNPFSELISLALFTIGRIDRLEFKGHGTDNNKKLTIKRNRNADFYVSMSEADQSINTVVGFEGSWMIGALAIIQIRDRLNMTQEEALQMLRLIPVPPKTEPE